MIYLYSFKQIILFLWISICSKVAGKLREKTKLTPIFYRENQTRCTVKFDMVIRYFELFPNLDPRDRDLENYYLSPPAENA
jgi:hypothetical protein